MRQAVMLEPRKIRIRDVEPPRPAKGEVRLRVRRIGVCGSDVHVWHGKHPYTSYPVVQGHEFSAEVESLGKGVRGLKVNQKVTALPQITCGKCAPCERGDYHICDKLKVAGFQAPGCAQELFVTDANWIVRLPKTFTFEQGAMVEPAAVAVHASSRAGDLDGKNVAVLGCGPIGNLVAQVARAKGARVLATEISDHRRDVTRRCGLRATSNPLDETLREAKRRVFGKRDLDVVFECVGCEQTLTEAVGAVGKGGTIIVVGVFGEKPRVDAGLVQDRELTLRGTLMYRREDYEEAVRLISRGRIATDPLESRHFALDDYAKAYRFIDRNREKCMKVFVDVTS